jgi:hypothetical protein
MMAKTKRTTGRETVAAYLHVFDHLLKVEIAAVQAIILNADEKLAERIKWAAPSFYYKHDLVTFNPRNRSRVHLVFHHEAVTQIPAPLLEGAYKDRRMLYLQDMQEVKKHTKEL